MRISPVPPRGSLASPGTAGLSVSHGLPYGLLHHPTPTSCSPTGITRTLQKTLCTWKEDSLISCLEMASAGNGPSIRSVTCSIVYIGVRSYLSIQFNSMFIELKEKKTVHLGFPRRGYNFKAIMKLMENTKPPGSLFGSAVQALTSVLLTL